VLRRTDNSEKNVMLFFSRKKFGGMEAQVNEAIKCVKMVVALKIEKSHRQKRRRIQTRHGLSEAKNLDL